jgi:hypothetical protein
MPGLLAFLQKYAPAAARNVIAAKKLTHPTLFFEPDWKLNQFDHPKPKLPGAAGADTSKAAAGSTAKKG